jgi:hypothetical protein
MKVTCKNCGKELFGEDANWKYAEGNGMCPKCRRFFDDEIEKQVFVIADSPEIRADTFRIQILNALLGCAIAVIGMGLFILSMRGGQLMTVASFVLFLFGAKKFYDALRKGPAEHARDKLSHRVDLRRFVQGEDKEH